ncbi:MAG: HAD-IA family hydrolase [Candidatus Lokiarchaeota archaeon]|nr:HAD-IA family hydrolase [Candidatus Lokiarchaeota archaeon]
MEKINLEKYKGIIFDMDGVIYNISEAIEKAVDDSVEKYKMNVKTEEILEELAHLIEEIQNFPVPKILLNSYDLLEVKFLEGLSYFKKLRIAIFLFNQFNKYKDAESSIYKGIDELIRNIYDKKLKLAILTNNKSQYAEDVLEKFNLTKFFDTIIGFNEVSEVKPSPEGILKIMNKWKIKPSETIFIGDMTTDVDAGKSANVKMVCVASGLAKKETLLGHNPDILVDNTEQLIKLFGL